VLDEAVPAAAQPASLEAALAAALLGEGGILLRERPLQGVASTSRSFVEVAAGQEPLEQI